MRQGAQKFIGTPDELDFDFDPDDTPGFKDDDEEAPPPKKLSQFADFPARPLTAPERRVDFAAIDSEMDRLIEVSRAELSGYWERAVEKLRREVVANIKTDTPAQLLRRVRTLQMDLDGFVAKLVDGAVAAYQFGQGQAQKELTAAGGPPKRFDQAIVGPEEPFDLDKFRGLLEARSFVVAEGMAAKVYSAIQTSLLNAWNDGVGIEENKQRLNTTFSALAAGQLISPGANTGFDYTSGAVQESTCRTLYNDAMNGGRQDLYRSNSDFCPGYLISEVAGGLSERNHPLSQHLDGLTIKHDHPAARKLAGAQHYNDRKVDVPVTVIDEKEPGFAWSSDAEIEAALAWKSELSPRFS